MFKIRDDANLDGALFKKSDDEFDQLWAYDELLFDKDTRIIPQTQFGIGGYLTSKRLENFYELSKLDLLEIIDNYDNK